MRGLAGFTLLLASAALTLPGVARAENDTAAGEPTVGVGMICNTSQQADRFVALRETGTEPQKAMDIVNKEAKDARACGLAAIAFIRDATVNNKAVNNKLVQVVRINVVAGFNGSGWQPVSNMVQYAVIEGEGETI
jgi:hypothetical protein